MKTLKERFFNKIEIIPFHECWEWTGSKNLNGYGLIILKSKWKGPAQRTAAHRLSYELYKGKIPKGLVIDHLCRNKGCVNPDHLEAVTVKENTLRGISFSAINYKKTHCKNGHEFSKENIYQYKGRRHCRSCKRINKKKKNNHGIGNPVSPPGIG